MRDLMESDVNEINQRITDSDKKIFKVFESPQISEKDVKDYLPYANSPGYMVAITPRSGSSYFCDLLAKTGKLGRPNEWINPNLMPGMLKARPANNAVQHLINMRKLTAGVNGLFGIKASFFQFAPMIDTKLDGILFNNFKFIALFRKNILMQAISLYIATETDVFHTNVQHAPEKLSKVDSFEYDDETLREWVRHIYKQELEWNKYLVNKSHVTIYYEDLIQNTSAHIGMVSTYLGIPIETPVNPEDSVFKKLGFDRSESIYNQFMDNKTNIDMMSELRISPERYLL